MQYPVVADPYVYRAWNGWKFYMNRHETYQISTYQTGGMISYIATLVGWWWGAVAAYIEGQAWYAGDTYNRGFCTAYHWYGVGVWTWRYSGGNCR